MSALICESGEIIVGAFCKAQFCSIKIWNLISIGVSKQNFGGLELSSANSPKKVSHRDSIDLANFSRRSLTFVFWSWIFIYDKALAKRLDICTEHSLNISQLVQCVDMAKFFGCSKMTEHCPVNISSVIGCTQILGRFRLKYACTNWAMFNRSGKTTGHLASTSSNKRNLILSIERFWLLSKSTEQLSTWLNKTEQGGKRTPHFTPSNCPVHVQCKCPVILPGLRKREAFKMKELDARNAHAALNQRLPCADHTQEKGYTVSHSIYRLASSAHWKTTPAGLLNPALKGELTKTQNLSMNQQIKIILC